jgi:transposase
MAKKVERKRIKVEDFVRAYMEAHRDGKTRKELAERLGINENTVYLRAAELRRKGVPLPLVNNGEGPDIVARAKAALAEFNAEGKGRKK